MSDYVTADWHLFHENILRECNRPFGNTNHLKKTITNNVNNTCQPDDDLWLVGDFSMLGLSHKGAFLDFIKRIKCRLHLVIGNHDKMTPLDYIRMGFVSVHTWFPLHEFHLIHDPYDPFTRNFPDALWLCGHVHKHWLVQNNRLNIGVDMWDFKPVSMKQVRHILKRYDVDESQNKTL